MQWFYSKGSQQLGPVPQQELEALIQSGTLSDDTLVWQEAFGSEWKALKQVPELASHLPEETAPQIQPLQPAVTSPIATPTDSTGPFPTGGEFTRRAREALTGHWGISAGVTLIYFVISAVLNQFAIASLLLTGPLFVGYSLFFIRVIRRQSLEVDQLFRGFSCFANALGTYLLSTVFILLWMLLLIVPGIIAMFAFAQIYFLLADHPDLKPMDAIRSSKALMDGHKGELFLLRLRFFGWMVLSIFTLGIGLFWVYPYWLSAEAAFYQELRDRQQTT